MSRTLIWTMPLLALVAACTSHDPSQELEIKDVEAYWAIDPAVGDRQYIAPVVRFHLRNKSKEPLSSIQATAAFRRKGEEKVTWGTDYQRVGGRRSVAADQVVLVVLKSDARYYSTGLPETMFEHRSFKDVRVEVFLRIGSSRWNKMAEAPVERRIGAKSVLQILQ